MLGQIAEIQNLATKYSKSELGRMVQLGTLDPAKAMMAGMMIQRNPYLLMANGQIALFASIYRSFKVLQAEAFMYMLQAT